MISALRRAVVPAAIAVLFVVLDRPLPAAFLMVIAGALLALGLARPDLAHRLDRGVARVAVGLAGVVGWVALTAVWLLLLVPAWAFGRAARLEMLRPKGTGAANGWAPRRENANPTGRTFVEEDALGEPRTSRWAPVRLVPLVVGWVVVALALNYGIGWAYDEFIGSPDAPDATEVVVSGQLTGLADLPALAESSWAPAHVVEFGDLDYRYEPYVLTRVEDAEGPQITVEDGVRRSYVPADLSDDAPTVWIFGGTTVFGLGQRDEHTIASEMARLSEDADAPFRVVNFGQPGHTTWQQWQFYERMVAERGAPDAAIFVGGYDDIRVQLELPSPDPTHYNVSGADRALTGDPPPTDVGEVIEEYQEDSVITRLVRRLQGIVGTAHASPVSDSEEGPAAYAADLHDRARVFLDYLSARDDTLLIVAWQPRPLAGPVAEPFSDMTVLGQTDVLDLSNLLVDRSDLYVDDTSVNEDGATLIAEELYEQVTSVPE